MHTIWKCPFNQCPLSWSPNSTKICFHYLFASLWHPPWSAQIPFFSGQFTFCIILLVSKKGLCCEIVYCIWNHQRQSSCHDSSILQAVASMVTGPTSLPDIYSTYVQQEVFQLTPCCGHCDCFWSTSVSLLYQLGWVAEMTLNSQ